jgi:hypothetical protein
MFTDQLDVCIGLTDAELDEQVRAGELELRRVQAEQAARLAVLDARGSYRAEGHRSLCAYLRGVCNHSNAEASQWRKLATVCNAAPELGDALLAGRVGVAQVLEIGRIHSNPRTRQYFAGVAPIFLERAELCAHRDLKADIDSFLNLADQDGAFDELKENIERRDAQVGNDDGTLHIHASGGDPLTGEEVVAIYETFVQREFEIDLAARREQWGDDAENHPLPRTAAQRRFDAIPAMARAAAAYGTGDAPSATVVVNVVCDADTLHDTFQDAELVAETDDGTETIEVADHQIDDIISTAGRDGAQWMDRRCETSSGVAIHPRQLLQAAIAGHIRRVIVDSQGVVLDMGRRQRLFTGPAREAAKLLARHCQFPGCNVPTRWAQVDHNHEWQHEGRTDQDNANVPCGTHNRFKSRARWRTTRDNHGNTLYVRPDGSTVLPVGARQPDCTLHDELQRCRQRFDEMLRHRDETLAAETSQG